MIIRSTILSCHDKRISSQANFDHTVLFSGPKKYILESQRIFVIFSILQVSPSSFLPLYILAVVYHKVLWLNDYGSVFTPLYDNIIPIAGFKAGYLSILIQNLLFIHAEITFFCGMFKRVDYCYCLTLILKQSC